MTTITIPAGDVADLRFGADVRPTMTKAGDVLDAAGHEDLARSLRELTGSLSRVQEAVRAAESAAPAIRVSRRGTLADYINAQVSAAVEAAPPGLTAWLRTTPSAVESYRQFVTAGLVESRGARRTDPAAVESEDERNGANEFVAAARAGLAAGDPSKAGTGFMDAAAALQTVLDLARQNIIGAHDNPEEHARQTAACDVIEDMAVNQLGDDAAPVPAIVRWAKEAETAPGHEDLDAAARAAGKAMRKRDGAFHSERTDVRLTNARDNLRDLAAWAEGDAEDAAENEAWEQHAEDRVRAAQLRTALAIVESIGAAQLDRRQ